MTIDRAKAGAAIEIKQQKRGDLVAEEIKRLITEKDLKPGDRLPREVELQQLFSVSKSTIRGTEVSRGARSHQGDHGPERRRHGG